MGSISGPSSPVRETPLGAFFGAFFGALLSLFLALKDQNSKRLFYQDRLGTNVGKTEKKGCAFFAGERSTPLRSEVFVGSDVLILGAVIAFFGHLVATS